MPRGLEEETNLGQATSQTNVTGAEAFELRIRRQRMLAKIMG